MATTVGSLLGWFLRIFPYLHSRKVAREYQFVPNERQKNNHHTHDNRNLYVTQLRETSIKSRIEAYHAASFTASVTTNLSLYSNLPSCLLHTITIHSTNYRHYRQRHRRKKQRKPSSRSLARKGPQHHHQTMLARVSAGVERTHPSTSTFLLSL